ncbi:ABC transporter permease [Mucilaginibacter koreensis]
MLKNYLNSALRSLLKNKGFTIINIAGLALGLATCLLILFYVADEFSYDKYNLNADRVFRVDVDIKFNGNQNAMAVNSPPLAAALVNNFPEVQSAARFRNLGGNRVRKGSQNVMEDRMVYADNSIFNVFTLPMVSGSPVNALTAPHTVVINESTAKKYFNRTNVVGQSFLLNDTALYKITGVIRDIPKQSHFNFDFFLSMPSLNESRDPTWLSNNFNTYVLLKPGKQASQLQAKFPALIKKNVGTELAATVHMDYDAFTKAGNYWRLNLIPLTAIHLQSNKGAELAANGNIQYVYIFSLVAIFILLIACVNFMNLSTARSANRAREVGVRKVLGSRRASLITQFILESVLITAVATVIAGFMAWVLLPQFNQMAGKELIITANTLLWLLPLMLIATLVIGGLAGSYPALYLSRFQPAAVLKGKLASGFKSSGLRSFLVVFQFFISVFLINGTLVIYHQLKYIQQKDLGYSRNQVLTINNTSALNNKAEAFKQEIKSINGVNGATLTAFTPTNLMRNSLPLFQDPTLDAKSALLTQFWSVDEDYINTLGMKVIAGRNFSKTMGTDTTGVILNEAAVKMLGMANPVSKTLYYPLNINTHQVIPYHVIGVIKDFNFNSLRDNITPLALTLGKDKGALSVRISAQHVQNILNQIESRWKEMAPGQEFTYSFMDQDFDAAYRSEQRTGKLFIVFTSLAIAIACLGLFGLAAYAAEQRTREISIRKVLGANMATILAMLSKDFIKLVFIALLIATPLAWFVMHKWLQNFAYRASMQWWIPVYACLGAVGIACLTISFQSIKAAVANPIKSLRSE